MSADISRLQYSARFIVLEQELERLRQHLLPSQQDLDPTGTYDDVVYTKTLAYRVLAHAEFEAYFEDRVRDLYLVAIGAWDKNAIMTKVVACMLAFSSVEFEDVPVTKSPIQISQKQKWDRKIKLTGRISKCANSYRHVIENNHGIKEENLLKLLLPIGIEADEIDDVWLASMNSFGEERGSIAHTSGSNYRTTALPDPKTELDKINNILDGLKAMDILLNQLRT